MLALTCCQCLNTFKVDHGKMELNDGVAGGRVSSSSRRNERWRSCDVRRQCINFFHARMTARFCLFPNLARRSRDTAHAQRTQRYCKFIIHGASEVIKTDRQFRSSYTPLWSCDGPKSDSDHSGSPLRSL